MANLIRIRSAAEYEASLSSVSSSSRSVLTSSENSISIIGSQTDQKGCKPDRKEDLPEFVLGKKMVSGHGNSETYTPQKVESLVRDFQGSFSTKRKEEESQVEMLKEKANLFGAPSKKTSENPFSEESQNDQVQYPKIAQRLTFANPAKQKDGFYTVPKLTSRILTYQECSDEDANQSDTINFLKKMASEKVKNKRKSFESEDKENLVYFDDFAEENYSPRSSDYSLDCNYQQSIPIAEDHNERFDSNSNKDSYCDCEDIVELFFHSNPAQEFKSGPMLVERIFMGTDLHTIDEESSRNDASNQTSHRQTGFFLPENEEITVMTSDRRITSNFLFKAPK